jgi:hypothetical protein
MSALIILVGASQAKSNEPSPGTDSKPGSSLALARRTAERGLAFLEADAVKWRKEKVCASCHQGTMTVWAMCEAKSRGYAVSAESMAETVKWHSDRLKDIDKPRDSRPGYNMVNTPAVYMALMARAIPGQEAITPDELKRIDGHLARHQEADGSWAWSLAPAQNRPPPVFESDEVVTLMACLDLAPIASAGPSEKSDNRESREKAAAWLTKTEPSDTTQAAAFRLLRSVWGKSPAKQIRKEIEQFEKRQNGDGGWSQVNGLPSDAYATGQALYVLSLAGVKSDRAPIQKGVAFLAANQKEDGSWPMTPRAQPGATPFKNPSPIIYFGSAWATLGLMRSSLAAGPINAAR